VIHDYVLESCHYGIYASLYTAIIVLVKVTSDQRQSGKLSTKLNGRWTIAADRKQHRLTSK